MTDLVHSVFISRQPLNTAHTYPKSTEEPGFHTDFLYICSEAYPSYSVNYQMSSFGIPGLGTDKAIVIDSMSGAIGRISLSGVRVGDSEYGSNAFFSQEIRRMRSILQLKNNAYILRIYNSSMVYNQDKDGHTKGELKSIGDTYVDFYVFIKSVDCSISAGKPKVMDVSLTLVQRNALMGFNIYSG